MLRPCLLKLAVMVAQDQLRCQIIHFCCKSYTWVCKGENPECEESLDSTTGNLRKQYGKRRNCQTSKILHLSKNSDMHSLEGRGKVVTKDQQLNVKKTSVRYPRQVKACTRIKRSYLVALTFSRFTPLLFTQTGRISHRPPF